MYKFIKKFLLVILILAIFLIPGCTNNPSNNGDNGNNQGGNSGTTPTKRDTYLKNQYMLEEEEASFNFFWETQNVNELLGGCGLIPDRYPSNGLASIASVGYGLASYIAGVKNGYITRQEGYDRCLLTLSHVKDLPKVHGFYYHFYQEKTGSVASGSEISNIDSAIFFCGALAAGKYFGDEVERLSRSIYEEAEWDWFVNPKTNNFYMSYDGSNFSGAWDVYGEQLMMYFLGAGSPTHPIDKKVYYAFKRNTGTYKGHTAICSWFGSIFTYQFSHAFIDFRFMVDENGTNWFDNSVEATLANYEYCVTNPENFNTFAKDQWGVTASDVPGGYSGLLGTYPAGTGMQKNFKNDGTIACCGAIGSLPFAPDQVMPVFKNYATLLDGDLIGVYGFKDAFNFDGQKVWIAGSVIGIDKGITVLMIENYRSEIIWDTFMQIDYIQNAIDILGFTRL
ncbi:MAG: hypothetical protein J5691_04260 [Bacilli bacterium]|nr:hypothetical protein [Bacilli bacterium]